MALNPELEAVSCPFGHASAPVHVLTGKDMLHGLPGDFSIVRCPECQMMWTNPRPTPQSIGAYYPDEYAPYNTTSPAVVRPSKGPKGWLGLENANRTPAIAPGRLFEIGCSSGRYLLTMRQEGWEVAGLEFSPHAAEKARQQGLDVVSGSAELLATQDDRKYDVIAAWMVIEHLHDPIAVLRSLRAKAEDNGYLVCSVPDASALEFRLFGKRWYALHLPAHLFHFTPQTIRRTLEAAGWKVEKIFWHSNPNNFLMSLHYVFREKGWQVLAELTRKVAQGEKWPRLRNLLGVALGLTHQSGRITVWARPA